MKRSLISLAWLAALLLAGCSSPSAATEVAIIGVAGAALDTYCITGGTGCSPAVIAYANLAISQATADAGILSQKTTTPAAIADVIANLQSALTQGQALQGTVSGQTNTEIVAIVNAVSVAVQLVTALETPAQGAAARAGFAYRADASVVIALPPLSRADRRRLEDMRAKIAKARK